MHGTYEYVWIVIIHVWMYVYNLLMLQNIYFGELCFDKLNLTWINSN